MCCGVLWSVCLGVVCCGVRLDYNENKQCEGDGEVIRKHLSKELEIFEATGGKNKY